MAKNRSIEANKRKMKRRNRHAVFSGASAKYVVRIDRGRYQDVTTTGHGSEEDQVPSGKHVVIPVGPVSLSKAVMSTGRGPDAVCMQEYYQRIHSYDKALPETIGLSEHMKEMKKFELTKRYKDFIKGVPKELHINFVDDGQARLDLFFSGTQFFWVEVNYKERYWRRSAIYGSKAVAIAFLKCGSIAWAETI